MRPIIVQILRAPIGGIRKHVFDILEELSNKDVQQILITNVDHSDRPIPKISNLIVYHLPIIDKPGPIDLIIFFKILFFLIKFKSIKVLHGHGAKGGIYARGLSLFLPGKCIYTPHGGSLHRVYGAFKNKIYDLIERVLIPFTDIYLFESKYSAETFYENIQDVKIKSVINYNGVDLSNITNANIYKAGNLIKLASFGLLRHLKGHDIGVKTCELLKQNGIPFSYTIYGSGEFRDELINLINSLNLQNEICIKEYCEDVIEEMQKFDFIFHPSRFESFGYVPAEAMSVKVPVLTSQIGGLKEVVDFKTGFMSSNNDPNEYYAILSKVYTDSSILFTIVEAAFEKVKTNFSKKVMLERICQIYGLTK